MAMRGAIDDEEWRRHYQEDRLPPNTSKSRFGISVTSPRMLTELHLQRLTALSSYLLGHWSEDAPKPRSSGNQSILTSDDLSKSRSACRAFGESRFGSSATTMRSSQVPCTSSSCATFTEVFRRAQNFVGPQQSARHAAVPLARNPTIENFRARQLLPLPAHRLPLAGSHPQLRRVQSLIARTNCCSITAFRSRQTRIASLVPVIAATKKNHCRSGKDREMSRSRVWAKVASKASNIVTVTAS